MNRPPLLHFVVGNGVVLGGVLIAMFVAIALWAVGGASVALPIGAIAAALCAGRARTNVVRYREWNRQWAALAPDQARQRQSPQSEVQTAPGESVTRRPGHHRVLWAVVALCWLYLATTVKTPDQRAGLAWFTLLIVGYLAAGFGKRLFRRRTLSLGESPKGATDQLVSQCVGRQLYPAPSLATAYQSLPTYCAAMLADGSGRG